MNTFYPLLAQHKVFVVPEVLEQTREERQTTKGGNLIYSILRLKYTFYAEDGSSVSAVVVGEGMDSGDKASNKAMAVGMKYAMFQVFCIPTEEMVDPDATAPEPSVPKEEKPQPRYYCADCKKPVEARVDKETGAVKQTAEEFAKLTLAQYKRVLCVSCAVKEAKKEKEPA